MNASLRLTGVTMLCPWARHIICCLVLVQPRKSGNGPNVTEKLFIRTYLSSGSFQETS